MVTYDHIFHVKVIIYDHVMLICLLCQVQHPYRYPGRKITHFRLYFPLHIFQKNIFAAARRRFIFITRCARNKALFFWPKVFVFVMLDIKGMISISRSTHMKGKGQSHFPPPIIYATFWDPGLCSVTFCNVQISKNEPPASKNSIKMTKYVN